MSHQDAVVLCENTLGSVRSCNCGGVNLVTGPMTLHLHPRDVLMMHELLVAAKEHIDSENNDSNPPRFKSHKNIGSVH